MTLTAGRLTINGFKLYHKTIGVNGGYTNMGLNYLNQSIGNGDFGFKSKNIIGLGSSAFTTFSQSIQTQISLGAIGSGGIVSMKSNGSIETMFENPWHYSLTTTINGAPFQPYGGALLNQLGVSNVVGGIIVNCTSGGLQYGIEGTKNSINKP